MSSVKNIFPHGTKVLVIDDCLSELNTIEFDKVSFLNSFGKTKRDIVKEIEKKKDHLPVIGASLKYNDDTKRTDYEGIKLLLEISEQFSNKQTFFILSFENEKELLQREFGYIFNAENIKLISYNELLRK
jgi:hypothetical protein